ncbi:hypothetical protein B296_00057170 [Ensete ventricosum]|uniref:Trehalose-phosphatase n=1 Tax=Ensete ventricosum TaxID=4639 RepID=A0A426X176_ENSVE|nr:hypothetical protein B296_00057170 [Ensete ventricosum]
MTRQNMVMQEQPTLTIAAAAAITESPSPFFRPPLRATGAAATYARHKKLLSRTDLGGGGGARRATSWIESMKASSPSQLSSTAAPVLATHGEDYDGWVKRHPSALHNFDELMAASKGKQIVMFLDYDGTLSPIVDDPDRAYMSDEMREAVRDAASLFPTAIVSGRCREKLSELYYAGSHGMDIKGPNDGPKHTKAKVLEIRPTIKWDKGKALEFLLQSLGELRQTLHRILNRKPRKRFCSFSCISHPFDSFCCAGFDDCNDVLPLYIGDDRTDEDAFKVLRDRGQGYGILVSKIAKETSASFSLREPAEVGESLLHIRQQFWDSSADTTVLNDSA